jgi:hypothetical protein
MAKRFTDTEKWKDEWFLDLSSENKLVWQYLLDNCTNAGRWKKSFKHLNFCCDVKFDNDKVKQAFDGKVIDRDGFFFIPKFLPFQYPHGLNSQKKALLAVVKELKDYKLLELVNKMFGDLFLSIGNQSVIDNLSIQDTDKDKEKDKDKDSVLTPQKHFYLKYQEVFNKPYVASFGKDGAIFKDMAKLVKTEDLIKAIDSFFASDDDFIKKGGYTVGMFKSQVNKFIGGKKNTTLIFKKE